VVPILGAPGDVHEVFRGKKELSTAMVRRLRAHLDILSAILLPALNWPKIDVSPSLPRLTQAENLLRRRCLRPRPGERAFEIIPQLNLRAVLVHDRALLQHRE
jgi:hypothetical protein